MAHDKDKNWEETLKEINNHLNMERTLLKRKLKQKLDDFKNFKEEINKEKSLNNTVNRAREDRIRKLELSLEHEKKNNNSLKLKNSSFEEEIRNLAGRLSVMEKENLNLSMSLQKKVSEINKLKMELLPRYGMSKAASGFNKIDKLENSIQETEDFYRSISNRIDKILRD